MTSLTGDSCCRASSLSWVRIDPIQGRCPRLTAGRRRHHDGSMSDPSMQDEPERPSFRTTQPGMLSGTANLPVDG
jgi:hypothetical protein